MLLYKLQKLIWKLNQYDYSRELPGNHSNKRKTSTSNPSSIPVEKLEGLEHT